jgi:hypothetical protein
MPEDAIAGKVMFRAEANIVADMTCKGYWCEVTDALPADNAAMSLPVFVSPAKKSLTSADDEMQEGFTFVDPLRFVFLPGIK